MPGTAPEDRRPDDRRAVFRQYVDAVGLHGMAGAEAAGLQPSEWFALSHLTREGPLTSGELSARTGLTTGATTRLIDRLQRAGYVRRTTDPGDRRKVLVEPVPYALADVDDVVSPARRRIAELLDTYSADELDLLFDYFSRAAPAFHAATEEIREAAGPRRRTTAADRL
ncbi:MarR family winged helix-turn-helix transcriptional regulator [Streptomyces sp. NPDC086023]|uniref:MarR family winged helix-turn-helix transcriptional regulator n=1 Tax=Streptomyces sp. NPDC086023 TaxID=3365746 RepID=UPI0037D698AD